MTQLEKFSLVNLPVVSTTSSDLIDATLCDICLAVPRVKEGFSKEKVQLLAQIVF